MRFVVGEGGLTIHEGALQSADLHYEGVANQRRGGADSLTKIIFQYNARREPITFVEIAEAAAAASAASADGACLPTMAPPLQQSVVASMAE